MKTQTKLLLAAAMLMSVSCLVSCKDDGETTPPESLIAGEYTSDGGKVILSAKTNAPNEIFLELGETTITYGGLTAIIEEASESVVETGGFKLKLNNDKTFEGSFTTIDELTEEATTHVFPDGTILKKGSLTYSATGSVISFAIPESVITAELEDDKELALWISGFLQEGVITYNKAREVYLFNARYTKTPGGLRLFVDKIQFNATISAVETLIKLAAVGGEIGGEVIDEEALEMLGQIEFYLDAVKGFITSCDPFEIGLELMEE